MEDFLDKSLYDPDYPGEGIKRHLKVSSDPKRQGKLLLLGVAGVLLVVAIIAIFFRAGNRSTEDLTSIKAQVDRFGEGLVHLKGMQDRVASLEKHEGGLRQSISKLDRSVKSLRGQLDKFSNKIDLMQKKLASVAANTETSSSIEKKSIPTDKMRYHEVRLGETLYQIGQKYGISVGELCRLNQIGPNQIIQPGHKLLVSPGLHQ
ncbi:MAG: LysM peptidoglycan-binding domain-containing protein [Desulfobacteraceae bacterium]|nr:LysM peptidoglycan-binding domain-containing protein [Desulfobacteraceae bacterium]